MKRTKTTIDIVRTGQKLRALAVDNDYSVKDIQSYLGLSCPQPIYRWYKGAILPSIDNLLKLSELYNMHMEDLIVKSNSINVVPVEIWKRERTEFEKRICSYVFRLSA